MKMQQERFFIGLTIVNICFVHFGLAFTIPPNSNNDYTDLLALLGIQPINIPLLVELLEQGQNNGNSEIGTKHPNTDVVTSDTIKNAFGLHPFQKLEPHKMEKLLKSTFKDSLPRPPDFGLQKTIKKSLHDNQDLYGLYPKQRASGVSTRHSVTNSDRKGALRDIVKEFLRKNQLKHATDLLVRPVTNKPSGRFLLPGSSVLKGFERTKRKRIGVPKKVHVEINPTIPLENTDKWITQSTFNELGGRKLTGFDLPNALQTHMTPIQGLFQHGIPSASKRLGEAFQNGAVTDIIERPTFVNTREMHNHLEKQKTFRHNVRSVRKESPRRVIFDQRPSIKSQRVVELHSLGNLERKPSRTFHDASLHHENSISGSSSSQQHVSKNQDRKVNEGQSSVVIHANHVSVHHPDQPFVRHNVQQVPRSLQPMFVLPETNLQSKNQIFTKHLNNQPSTLQNSAATVINSPLTNKLPTQLKSSSKIDVSEKKHSLENTLIPVQNPKTIVSKVLSKNVPNQSDALVREKHFQKLASTKTSFQENKYLKHDLLPPGIEFIRSQNHSITLSNILPLKPTTKVQHIPVSKSSAFNTRTRTIQAPHHNLIQATSIGQGSTKTGNSAAKKTVRKSSSGVTTNEPSPVVSSNLLNKRLLTNVLKTASKSNNLQRAIDFISGKTVAANIANFIVGSQAPVQDIQAKQRPNILGKSNTKMKHIPQNNTVVNNTAATASQPLPDSNRKSIHKRKQIHQKILIGSSSVNESTLEQHPNTLKEKNSSSFNHGNQTSLPRRILKKSLQPSNRRQQIIQGIHHISHNRSTLKKNHVSVSPQVNRITTNPTNSQLHVKQNTKFNPTNIRPSNTIHKKPNKSRKSGKTQSSRIIHPVVENGIPQSTEHRSKVIKTDTLVARKMTNILPLERHSFLPQPVSALLQPQRKVFIDVIQTKIGHDTQSSLTKREHIEQSNAMSTHNTSLFQKYGHENSQNNPKISQPKQPVTNLMQTPILKGSMMPERPPRVLLFRSHSVGRNDKPSRPKSSISTDPRNNAQQSMAVLQSRTVNPNVVSAKTKITELPTAIVHTKPQVRSTSLNRNHRLKSDTTPVRFRDQTLNALYDQLLLDPIAINIPDILWKPNHLNQTIMLKSNLFGPTNGKNSVPEKNSTVNLNLGSNLINSQSKTLNESKTTVNTYIGKGSTFPNVVSHMDTTSSATTTKTPFITQENHRMTELTTSFNGYTRKGVFSADPNIVSHMHTKLLETTTPTPSTTRNNRQTTESTIPFKELLTKGIFSTNKNTYSASTFPTPSSTLHKKIHTSTIPKLSLNGIPLKPNIVLTSTDLLRIGAPFPKSQVLLAEQSNILSSLLPSNVQTTVLQSQVPVPGNSMLNPISAINHNAKQFSSALLDSTSSQRNTNAGQPTTTSYEVLLSSSQQQINNNFTTPISYTRARVSSQKQEMTSTTNSASKVTSLPFWIKTPPEVNKELKNGVFLDHNPNLSSGSHPNENLTRSRNNGLTIKATSNAPPTVHGFLIKNSTTQPTTTVI